MDIWEAEREPCDIVGCKVNDITFITGLEVILKGIGDILYTNGEVIRGYNINNKA